MNNWKIYGLLLYSISAVSLHADLLGTASSFAVLGGSTVTNTGPSVISGNLGVSPGSAITGFPPGAVINGTTYAADPGGVAAQAHNDAFAAYTSLEGFTFTQDLTGQNLGGLTLTPGVYKFDSSAQLTGQLTLDGLNLTNPLFVFQIGSTLTTASNSSVVTTNGADCCNVYWQIGSSATLGTNTEFQGNLLALASITLTAGASITEGRALTLAGAVTLDTNSISTAVCDTITVITDSEVPEPGSLPLLGAGIFGLVLLGRIYGRRTT